MEKKLKRIFDFLIKNRKYNKALHKRYYKSIIGPYGNNKDKLISLLYNIINTQSRPKIDYLAEFFKTIILNEKCTKSMKDFILVLNLDKNVSGHYNKLYNGLVQQKGWGEKTSALFVKSIFHLHNGEYSNRYEIWNDVPKHMNENDNIYLPVDIVITSIFKRLNREINWNFKNINSKLREYNYIGKDIEIWDDLWFWGFITQNGTGNDRIFEWNEEKYWAYRESDKNPKIIKEIKERAKQFIKILKS